jgi:glycosyltransferase involved in cell wall biosynthesis
MTGGRKPRRMTKNLYLTSSYIIGLTSLLAEQARALEHQAPGEFVFVSGEREQIPGLFERVKSAGATMEIIHGLDNHRSFADSVRGFRNIINRYHPAIVHVHTNWQLGIAIVARFLAHHHFSIFYTVHGYRHNFRFRSFIARYVIGLGLVFFADRVIVPSTFLKKIFFFMGKKIRVLPLGVDDDFFMGQTDLPPMHPKQLIFPAEFRSGKNQDMLIRALHSYIERTEDRGIILHLPGKGQGLEECRALAKTLGLENNVAFPGFLDREHLLELYQTCHLAVIPTNIETFGLSIVEPFVLGRVVITRNVGIVEDLIIDGYNGFVFDNEDDLADLLCRILSDETLLYHVGQRTALTRDRFRWDQITSEYLRLVGEHVRRPQRRIEDPVQEIKHVVVIWAKFLPYHLARLLHLQKRLRALGWRLTAIQVSSKDDLYSFVAASESKDLDFITCFDKEPYQQLRPAHMYAKVSSVLNALKPDIVFAPATPFPSGMASAKYRLRHDTRLIMMDDAWEHSDRRGPFVTWIKKKIHQNIDAVFIPAASHRPYFEKLGFPSDRIVYGVDVVDNEHFSKGASEARSRRTMLALKYGLPTQFFLFVGRYLPEKGIRTLLRAYESYHSMQGDKAWALVLVGDGREKVFVQRYAKRISGIMDVGPRDGDELNCFYGLASAFILPSDVDTWGLVINEAMASALPVVVSDGCGSARALVRENENGWIFAGGDHEQLAEAMVKCAQLPEQALRAMGDCSREIISQWSLDYYADGVVSASRIPRRPKADIISNVLTKSWIGRINAAR